MRAEYLDHLDQWERSTLLATGADTETLSHRCGCRGWAGQTWGRQGRSLHWSEIRTEALDITSLRHFGLVFSFTQALTPHSHSVCSSVCQSHFCDTMSFSKSLFFDTMSLSKSLFWDTIPLMSLSKSHYWDTMSLSKLHYWDTMSIPTY